MICRKNKVQIAIATGLLLAMSALSPFATGCDSGPPPKAPNGTNDPQSPTGKLPQEATSPTPQVQTSADPASTNGATADSANANAAPTVNSSSEKPKKISAAHVLIQYMGCANAGPAVVRTKEQARTVAEKIRERAKSGEDFSRLAVDYSDEPGAAQRGGSLGRFGHGQMVKPFEDAAFALQVGEISDVVETQFGFHIIKRTE